ncbi:MAG TPA: hypothetical protein VGM07_10555 [Stellaceae bacterium]|jgi:hypothetical protein
MHLLDPGAAGPAIEPMPNSGTRLPDPGQPSMDHPDPFGTQSICIFRETLARLNGSSISAAAGAGQSPNKTDAEIAMNMIVAQRYRRGRTQHASCTSPIVLARKPEMLKPLGARRGICPARTPAIVCAIGARERPSQGPRFGAKRA